MICAICVDNPADYMCVPCGHQSPSEIRTRNLLIPRGQPAPEDYAFASRCRCGCGECLAEVKRSTNECPICRAPIGSLQRVFQSGVVELEGPSSASQVRNFSPVGERAPESISDDEHFGGDMSA
jgi:hypothetical protein